MENDSGIMPEVRTKTQVAQGEENTVQPLLSKLTSVFSSQRIMLRLQAPWRRGTGVSQGAVLVWDQLVSLQGHPREVRVL